MSSHPSRLAAGFTLIEVMIVVVILAILSSIAYASYSGHVIKSRRAAAATCLQERAQFMERYYTTNLTYAGAAAPAACGPDLDAFYTVAFDGVPDGKTYVIQATPTSRQADTKCAVLGINAQGVRTASGSYTATPEQCW
ncbi:type IV pilin protein [Luteimonas changyuni]|uniref:type IV pilin protein n=1 Tax=Luteimonas sp. MJ145 TaxID=3129234 RepID=UPI0031B9E5CC